MKLIIDIPKDEIPKRQEIMEIDLHFIDGKVCECTYPFEEITNLSNNDLISREALKKACSEMVRGSNNSDFIPCPTWNNAMELIDNAPSVDTYTKDDLTREYLKGHNDCRDMNERPQGEWIPQTDFDGFTYWKCSKCNKKNNFEIFNFCPNCGADMRKGEKE